MSRELLLSRVGDNLNVIGQERELAANTFLQRVVARLDFDQSIRIRGIGVFQLKKEPLPRVDRRTKVDDGPANKRTLIYAPIHDELSKNVNSAFVSFDLDELQIESSDYLEKVFSLNIDKPLIPAQDNSSSGFDSKVFSDDHNETLEEKVEKMVNEGEILQDFNIFENYLFSDESSKTPDEIEEDDLVKEELLKSIGNVEEEKPDPEGDSKEDFYLIPDIPEEEKESSDDNPEPEAEQPEEEIIDVFSEPGEKQLEEEIINETIEPEAERLKEEIIDESSEPGEKQLEEEIIDETIQPEAEPLKEEIIDESEDKKIEVTEPESKDEELLDELIDLTRSEENAPVEVESNKEDLFAKLENYLKDEGSAEEKPDSEKTNEEEEINSDFKNEDEIVEELRLNEIEVEEKRVRKKSIRDESFFTKPGFIVTLISIIVIAVLVYVFRDSEILEGDSSSSTNVAVTGTLPDQDLTGNAVQADDSLTISNVENTDNDQRTGIYREIPNDVQTVKQIYFDGSRYTIQVSSWKNAAIAETQVERLRSKGFDAFIFKIYLESKKSTWHRVRIGYFNSLEEAENFVKKNKF